MSLKTRRILYISFIIFFILVSAATITYTAGYRFHFKKYKFQKNGGIFLEFKPKEVNIYINNKLEELTGFFDNSFKITDLLPGEYTIKITKDGYYSWEKLIKVEEDKINFLKNIILFKKNTLPKLVTERNIINLYNATSTNNQINRLKEIPGLKEIDNVLDFKIVNNKIYLIQNENEKFILQEIDRNDFSKKTLLDNISASSTFQFAPKPFLFLLDEKDNNLMVINTKSQEIILQDKAKNILWTQKLKSGSYKIAYNNDFEIYVYDLLSNEKNLIARYSEKINEILWHPEYNHLFFVFNDSINIIELTDDEKNLHTLFTGEDIKNITVSDKGDKIFFNGKIGNQIGLFELEIL
ncbi:hypothetical protein HOD96_00685 [Candidatus Falkowbacteria bacterium]|jgi:hypothetical protein|nr:hypothetical protein [Candidatus Falkowbacteria bacterium]MBT4433246.1 hypothetical protein [Candidatus Falkowbacteria bacterium]